MNLKKTLIAASIVTSSAISLTVSTGAKNMEKVKYKVENIIKPLNNDE